MKRRHRGLFALALLLPGVGAAAYRVTTLPAWQGHYRPGGSTGLEIEVRAEAGGRAVLRLEDGRLDQVYVLDIPPQGTRRVATVVTPPDAGQVQWRIEGEDGRLHGAVTYRPLPSGRALIADLTPSARADDAAGPLRVAIAPERLPAATAAWAPLGGVQLDRAGLAGLAPGARRALGDWLAGCGAVGSDDPALVAALATLAGCGGEALVAGARIATPRTPALLDPSRLEPLLDRAPPSRLLAPLGGLLALYLVALWLLRRGRVAWLLALPFCASGIAVATLGPQRGTLDQVTWEEQVSGAADAVRSQLWRHHGGGRGLQPFPVAPPLPLPLDPAPAARATLLFDDGGPRLLLDGALLARIDLGAAHRVPGSATLTLRREGEHLAVTNGTAEPFPASRLHDGRGIVDVPPLAPASSWRVGPETPRRSPHDPAERLLAERAAAASWLLAAGPGGWRVVHLEAPR